MNPAKFDIPEAMWRMVEPILPKERARPFGGRPPLDNYRVLCGILYRLRTGCQWRAIPDRFGSGPTLHRRFQQWVKAGVFHHIFEICLRFYNDLEGIDWEWMAIDSATVKSPKGGSLTGRNPTDRGKLGVKRHILVDGRGVPVAITVSAANANDNKMFESTVDAVPIHSGRGIRRPKNLCMDKGYDDSKIRTCAKAKKIKPHIRRRGEPPIAVFPRSKKRRWVVERANSWHNRWRGILTRWERIGDNYLNSVLLVSACVAFQQAMGGFNHMF